MLNRGSSSLYDDDESSGLLGMAWQVERYPLVRLSLLLVFLVSPLVAVGWRVAQLQTQMASVYAAEFSNLTERTEEIPCLDGCIFANDGQILAHDVPGLDVQVHYRWIEEPPDPLWLKQKAQQRLPRAERRKPARLQAAQEQVLEERAALWKELASVTGTDPKELSLRRQKIQARMIKMQESAARRRQILAQRPALPSKPATTWLEATQNWMAEVIATPQETHKAERVVLKEELDYYPLISGISPTVRGQLKNHPEKYPSLRIVDITHREYPMGHIAPHIVGFRKPLGQEEWQKRQALFPGGDPLGYQPDDRIGQMGIEKFHERHLRGVRGTRKVVVNAHGEIVEEREIRAPRPGRDLELTLNLAVQADVEKLLADAMQTAPAATTSSEDEVVTVTTLPRSGCIAVMDVRTGEMIAAASWPSFDLNVYMNGDDEAIRHLEADSRKPLYSRLHQMLLPPGSVFKTVTATAMLHAGMNGHTPFHCQGFLRVPTRKRCLPFVRYGTNHGDVDLSMAMAQSCNVYFYHAAEEMGAPALLDWAGRFGFGKQTGIDLPGESAGNLPSGRCDHLSVAIGQERLIVTPLQIVRMMAAIANGGEMVTPRVARRTGSSIVTDDQSSYVAPDVLATPQPVPIADISTSVLEQVREGLEQVVANPRGTGYKTVRMSEVTIAGKSGTAEANGGPNHAWFAGYVPADRPRYSFVAVLERGGAGGKAAGPLAKQTVQALLRAGLIDSPRQLTRIQNDVALEKEKAAAHQ
jgi:penicillin-binding protein 2